MRHFYTLSFYVFVFYIEFDICSISFFCLTTKSAQVAGLRCVIQRAGKRLRAGGRPVRPSPKLGLYKGRRIPGEAAGTGWSKNTLFFFLPRGPNFDEGTHALHPLLWCFGFADGSHASEVPSVPRVCGLWKKVRKKIHIKNKLPLSFYTLDHRISERQSGSPY